jgi:hypothetical protein
MPPPRKGNIGGQAKKNDRMPVADRWSSSPRDSKLRFQSFKIIPPRVKAGKEKFDYPKSLPQAFTFIYTSSVQKVTAGSRKSVSYRRQKGKRTLPIHKP